MLTILASISPVFLVVALGFACRRVGFLPDPFIHAANRLVYYLAVPLLIFGQVSEADFLESFNPVLIGATVLAVLGVTLLALAASAALRLPLPTAATFAQNAFHGNTGYIGLAMVLYVLGEKGLASASVLAGFVMLANNLTSLALYTFLPLHRRRLSWAAVRTLLGNPIVLAALLGLGCSAMGIRIPPFLSRTVAIVGEMALPLGLLIIGASLRTETRGRLPLAIASSAGKLLALPFLGWALYRSFGIPAGQIVPALILLATPSATISFVMAREMEGDPDLAAAAVTLSTILSMGTYILWITLAGAG